MISGHLLRDAMNPPPRPEAFSCRIQPMRFRTVVGEYPIVRLFQVSEDTRENRSLPKVMGAHKKWAGQNRAFAKIYECARQRQCCTGRRGPGR